MLTVCRYSKLENRLWHFDLVLKSQLQDLILPLDVFVLVEDLKEFNLLVKASGYHPFPNLVVGDCLYRLLKHMD